MESFFPTFSHVAGWWVTCCEKCDCIIWRISCFDAYCSAQIPRDVNGSYKRRRRRAVVPGYFHTAHWALHHLAARILVHHWGNINVQVQSNICAVKIPQLNTQLNQCFWSANVPEICKDVDFTFFHINILFQNKSYIVATVQKYIFVLF